MRALLASRNVRLMVGLWGGFWPVTWFVPRDVVYNVVYSLSIAACFGVVVAYLPSVKKFFLRNDLDGPHYLVIGITGMLGLTALRQIWTWVFYVIDQQENMTKGFFIAWLTFCMFTCACIHLMARGVVQGEIPRENWRWLGIVLTIGVSIALMLIGGTVAELP
jgi:uncharacterized membrane protein YecN with MAPEG domain